jgi:hypothetical protein
MRIGDAHCNSAKLIVAGLFYHEDHEAHHATEGVLQAFAVFVRFVGRSLTRSGRQRQRAELRA